MAVEKKTQPPEPEVIAMPPLKMTLAHITDDLVDKKSLSAAIRKLLPQEEPVVPSSIERIIKFLENKP
jgi:hypothetical protein